MIASIDCLKNKASHEKLTIRQDELKGLESMEYGTRRTVAHRGYKVCATRHGCSGATNCDYSYGNYHK